MTFYRLRGRSNEVATRSADEIRLFSVANFEDEKKTLLFALNT